MRCRRKSDDLQNMKTLRAYWLSCVHFFELKGIKTSYMDSSLKNSRPVFLSFFELSPLVKLRPYDKIRMKFCKVDAHILKSINARALKLSQLIMDDV